MILIATCQSPITPDVAENGRVIRAQMVAAAAAGVRIVHFPECALSGYADAQIGSWADVDWAALRRELTKVARLARRLGVWVVVGANHRRRGAWPNNSLFVISDAGQVVGRYDKRLCSNTEVTWWYSAGTAPLVFDVDGIRFGCALCIEVVFPHLFAEYERQGVDCVLLSAYSADPIHGVMARAHAASCCMWISHSTPVACSHGNPSAVFGPDGHALARCAAGEAGLVVHTIDPGDERYRVPLAYARPWRARARSGEIYGSGGTLGGMAQPGGQANRAVR